jgi:hypothetical protein
MVNCGRKAIMNLIEQWRKYSSRALRLLRSEPGWVVLTPRTAVGRMDMVSSQPDGPSTCANESPKPDTSDLEGHPSLQSTHSMPATLLLPHPGLHNEAKPASPTDLSYHGVSQTISCRRPCSSDRFFCRIPAIEDVPAKG